VHLESVSGFEPSLPVDDPDAVLAQGHAASAVGVASADDRVPRAAGASATTTSMPGKARVLQSAPASKAAAISSPKASIVGGREARTLSEGRM
jgi:hypothetical protein